MSAFSSQNVHSLSHLLSRAALRYTCPQSLENLAITHVVDDSRRVSSGCLFVAVRGTQCDGHDYIANAIDAGARAVVISDPVMTDPRVPCIVVRDSADAFARLCGAHSGLAVLQDSGQLSVVGVTGTNGKSTTCHLIQNVMRFANRPCALLGTIAYDLVGRTTRALWTTPPADQLALHLVEARQHGASCAVMEVSSHALEQRRTSGVQYAVGVFTNLSGDHLDYHIDVQSYLTAKKRLFDTLAEDATAVINADDPVAEQLIHDCRAHIVRYSMAARADVFARNLSCGIEGGNFILNIHGRPFALNLPLVGRHNVSNALAAASAAAALGVDPGTIQKALEQSGNVAGRLQRAEPQDCPFSVFVDYAHTDHALENVLSSLRRLAEGELWCVFGCGGDRDRSKRPRMAAASARYADQVVVTSDNPRTEEPMDIIDDIIAGFKTPLPPTVHVEPDRRSAIGYVLERAQLRDVVLIAGKGHEDYQIVGDQRLHFDDVETVRELLDNSPRSNTKVRGNPAR